MKQEYQQQVKSFNQNNLKGSMLLNESTTKSHQTTKSSSMQKKRTRSKINRVQNPFKVEDKNLDEVPEFNNNTTSKSNKTNQSKVNS